MKKILAATLAILCIAPAVPAVAQEVVYDCETRHKTNDGWITPRYVFFVDESIGTARVVDGIIQHYNGGPIPAKMQKRSETSYKLRWIVSSVKATQGTKDQEFRAILHTKSMKFTVEPHLPGFDNFPRGEGRCKIAK